MPLSNKTLETICYSLIGIILLYSFYKAIREHFGWTKETNKGDDLDDLTVDDFIDQF